MHNTWRCGFQTREVEKDTIQNLSVAAVLTNGGHRPEKDVMASTREQTLLE